MPYQLSKNLASLLENEDDQTPIALSILAEKVSALSQDEHETAALLLQDVRGNLSLRLVYQYLHDCIAYDSVVRDIITSGHLGKFLSRFVVFSQSWNPAIVGLPHNLFDKQSQKERAEFFAQRNILPIDADVLKDDLVREMLEREESLLRNRG